MCCLRAATLKLVDPSPYRVTASQFLPAYAFLTFQELSPCTGADVGLTTQAYAHRYGLKVEIGQVGAGTFIRLGVETQPRGLAMWFLLLCYRVCAVAWPGGGRLGGEIDNACVCCASPMIISDGTKRRLIQIPGMAHVLRTQG